MNANKIFTSSALLCFTLCGASAQQTWTNNQGTGFWNNVDTNWGAGAAWIDSGIAIFDAGGANPNVNAAVNVANLTLNAAKTIGGTGPLTFTGPGLLTVNATSTISTPITGTVTKVGSGQLDIATLNAGATLIVNAGTVRGNTGGGIKGSLRIDSGATFRNTVAHIFDTTPTSTARIHINGGTLAHGPAGNPEYYVPQGTSAADPGVQMTGGLWDTGENRFVSAVTAHMRFNAASTTATIAGEILSYQGGTQVYNVVGGTVPGGVDLRVSGTLGGNFGGGTTHLTKTGAGLMEITVANTYTGATNITGGVLALSHASALGTGPVVLTANTTTLSLGSSTVNINFANNVTVNAGSGGAVIKFAAGVANEATTATGDWVFNTAVTLDFSSGINNSYNLKHPISGNGSLTVVENGFSGNERISLSASGFTGVLNIASTASVEPTLSAANGNTVNNSGRFWLGGKTYYVGQLNGNGVVTSTAAVLPYGILSVGNNNATGGNYTGTISNGAGTGSGNSVIKEGTGTQTFSGANITYTGPTTVSGGTFSLQNTTAFGSASIANAATISLYANGNNAVSINSVKSGAGLWQIDGPGGGTAMQNRILFRGDGSALTGTIQVINNGKFFLDRGVNAIGDAVAVNVGPSATFYLSAANGSDGFGTFLVDETIGGLSGSGNVYSYQADGTTGPRLTIGGGDATATFSGNIGEANLTSGFRITKIGAGTQTFSGNNTYAGATAITDGTLLINGTHTGAGLITASSGATLGGSGTMVSVEIANGGILAPGSSAGIITMANLDLNPSSILEIELGDPSNPSASDRVLVTGFFNDFGGKLNVSALPGLGTPGVGASWLVIDYPVVNGSFNGGSNLALGTNTTGLNLALDVSIPGQVLLVVVPEPAAGALFALALVLLRRRVPVTGNTSSK